jgi:hypothetical protein
MRPRVRPGSSQPTIREKDKGPAAPLPHPIVPAIPSGRAIGVAISRVRGAARTSARRNSDASHPPVSVCPAMKGTWNLLVPSARDANGMIWSLARRSIVAPLPISASNWHATRAPSRPSGPRPGGHRGGRRARFPRPARVSRRGEARAGEAAAPAGTARRVTPSPAGTKFRDSHHQSVLRENLSRTDGDDSARARVRQLFAGRGARSTGGALPGLTAPGPVPGGARTRWSQAERPSGCWQGPACGAASGS